MKIEHEQMLSYVGHAMRGEESMRNSIILGTMEGTWKRGSLSTWWMDQAKDSTGLSLAEAVQGRDG